jgi:small nuclear ribonucleoprotein (snRNP)-like protein
MSKERNNSLEIDKYTKRTRGEKPGYVIGLELKNGEKIFGRLVKTDKDTLYVETLDEPVIVKDVHRVLIKRRMILLTGGHEGNGRED